MSVCQGVTVDAADHGTDTSTIYFLMETSLAEVCTLLVLGSDPSLCLLQHYPKRLQSCSVAFIYCLQFVITLCNIYLQPTVTSYFSIFTTQTASNDCKSVEQGWANFLARGHYEFYI